MLPDLKRDYLEALEKIHNLVQVDDYGGWTDASGILESVGEITEEFFGAGPTDQS